MDTPLDLDRVFSAFGLSPNLAKRYQDNPLDLKTWISGQLYRGIATGLYPDAQMIDAPDDQKAGMAEVNSALSMLNQTTDEAFSAALQEMASSSTPGFSRMRGMSDDLKHAEATISKQQRRNKGLVARLEAMRNFELRLIEHLTMSAVTTPVGPVIDRVNFSRIRNCVIVTADEIFYVTSSGFVNSKNWIRRDISVVPLFLGREAKLYSRNFESTEIALSQGKDPTKRMPEASLFDRFDNQVLRFQIIGGSPDSIIPQSSGVDGIDVDSVQIPNIIRELDPEIRVGQRLALLAKTGTGIESIEMVARQRIINRKPGLVFKTTGKVVAIVGPFELNQNSVNPPRGFELEYPKKRVAKPGRGAGKKRIGIDQEPNA